ncbi:MAG: hypothetical protein ACE5JH_07490 [Acidobacteriota bacterium]
MSTGRLRDRVEQEANRLLRERLSRVRRSLEEALGRLGAPMRIPLTPGEWGAAGGTGHLDTLRDAADAMARGRTRREILTALLDAAAAFYSRTALFILRGTTLTGWSGLGFMGEGGFGSRDLPRVTLQSDGGHLMALAIRNRSLATSGQEGPGSEIADSLGGVRPREASAVPILVRSRPVAVLYGDTGTGAGPGTGLALEILARFAGLAMERLAGYQAQAGRAHAGAIPAAPDAARPPARKRDAPPPSVPPTPPEEAEIQALIGEIDAHPRRTSGDDGLSDEQKRMLGDARRFARLLVSELLLYNEEAVMQGRRNRDIYRRLRREIDRSRQAYEARIAGHPVRSPDFFQDELIRVLAQGDPGVLGN